MPYLNDKFNVGPQILWDTLTVPVATATGTDIRLYVDPISGTKTKLLTNMQLVSQLPEPQVYKAIGIQFKPAISMLREDVQNLFANFWWEFWVGDRIYGEGHFEDAPGGSQLTGFDVGNGATVINNGDPNFQNYYSFSMPAMEIGSGQYTARITGYEGVDINRSERFYVKLLSPNGFTTAAAVDGGTGINMRVNLLGFIARQVQ